MQATINDDWLAEQLAVPSEHASLEFKEAKQSISVELVADYCVAIANEGGGHLILGVSNARPRRIVGSSAFQNPAKLQKRIFDRIRMRIGIQVLRQEGKRILIIAIPSRPTGTPLEHNGRFCVRAGDAVVGMTAAQLQNIFEESRHDFSAEVCGKASIQDLDADAVQLFRNSWERREARKESKERLRRASDTEMLNMAELMTADAVTNAALLLLGSAEAVARLLPQAEVVFEYRSGDMPGPAQQRIELRAGFLTHHDQLWEAINARNDQQFLREGLFVHQVYTFNEVVVREAVVNAVCHRDYRLNASVFIRQSPRRLEIDSPGGFPAGITTENFLRRNVPRNRRLAENLARCGLVERAGQGVPLIYRHLILEGKHEPDFSRSDHYQVRLALRGEVQDPRFVEFFRKLEQEQPNLSVEDLIVADRVYRGVGVVGFLESRIDRLLELGIIERVGRKRFILSSRFYRHLGEGGVYTRKRGLTKPHEKALLLEHLRNSGRRGSDMEELAQVVPTRDRRHITRLLQELKREGSAVVTGRTRAAKWYAPEAVSDGSEDGQGRQ